MNRTWKIFFYIKLTIKLIILIYHNSDSSFDLGIDLSFNHFTNFSFIQDVQFPNFTYFYEKVKWHMLQMHFTVVLKQINFLTLPDCLWDLKDYIILSYFWIWELQKDLLKNMLLDRCSGWIFDIFRIFSW